MTSKILAPSLFVLLVAGCSNTQTNSGSSATTKLATANAQRVHGDLVPTHLLALAVPKPTETALLGGSDALAPRKPFDIDVAPDPVVGHIFQRVMRGSDPTAFTFPVDAPAGARVIVRTVDPTQSVVGIHLRSVATGAVLDLARDPSNTLRVGHGAGEPDPQLAGRGLQDATQNGTLRDRVDSLTQREPGLTASLLNHRVLAFDLPTTAGLVRLDVPANVAASGVIMELQQPNSHITLTGVAAEHNYTYQDTAELTFNLANDSTPIDGARLTGHAELSDHSSTPDFTITPIGGGVYRASIPLTTTDAIHNGVWGIHVKSTGTFNGVAFERDVETSFGYYPSHAQMTAVSTPRITRGGDGLIDDVAVDVDVQSLADDRFSVRGTLTYVGSDGAEHGIASAQTGQTMTAGTATMTLHFSAASIALARIDGPFHVRDLALVSQGFGYTEHRLGLGLGIVTDSFKATEIRFPAQISMQAQDLIRNGDLEAVK